MSNEKQLQANWFQKNNNIVRALSLSYVIAFFLALLFPDHVPAAKGIITFAVLVFFAHGIEAFIFRRFLRSPIDLFWVIVSGMFEIKSLRIIAQEKQNAESES